MATEFIIMEHKDVSTRSRRISRKAFDKVWSKLGWTEVKGKDAETLLSTTDRKSSATSINTLSDQATAASSAKSSGKASGGGSSSGSGAGSSSS